MNPYVELVVRERGKLVERVRGTNIWLNFGRTWLRNLACWDSGEQRRIMYMGFGIGGSRQSMQTMASQPPLSTDYPGGYDYTDIDGTHLRLERPVRPAGGTYLRALTPPTFPSPHSVKFSAVFTEGDFNYGSYLAMPLSEIGLFLQGSNPAVVSNSPVAYDTFNTIQKTSMVTLEVNWVVSF